MSALERIAFFQNRRDEVPNQELARALAETQDEAGLAEIAANLAHRNSSVRSDCIKVLYEVGYLAPELIAPYVQDFLSLLASKDNRMVWGGLIALTTIAPLRPDEIGAQAAALVAAVEHGSVISVVWGMRALAQVAAVRPALRAQIVPHLLNQLETCIPRDVPLHAESVLCAIDDESRPAFDAILARRQPELSPAQAARLKKALKNQ
jgi:HEAT repeat protein